MSEDAGPSDPLGALIRRLREAGADPGATELADALWLAGRMADAETGAGSGAGSGPDAGSPDGTPSGEDGLSPDPADRPGPPQLLAVVRERREKGGQRGRRQRREQEAERAGRTEPAYDAPGAEILVPTASAFPDLLSLGHALRPFRGRQWRTGPPRPRSDDVLDESLTAQASAVANCALPVFRADRRRRARMQLLVDDSPSMGAWERTLEELRLACDLHPITDRGPAPGVGG